MICRACRGEKLSVLIDVPAPGLTSLAMVWPHPVVVHLCDNCGHLSTASFPQNEAYYADQYDTVGVEDDDLMYVDRQGRGVYRVEQQCVRLLELVDVGPSGRLLDFGCGHGVFLRRFCEQRPRWDTFGYEVSHRYSGPGVFIGELPHEQFDLITSFYVLEHVDDPVASVRELGRRLAVAGTLFLAVPDTVANPIDVLAGDHLSHFGLRSLRTMLDRAGLSIAAASRRSMPGTWLVAACHAQAAEKVVDSVDSGPSASDLGRYWTDAEASLKHAVGLIDTRAHVAIYGAGVYGAYVKMRSARLGDAVRCFVDRNPRKRGTTFHGLPVHDVAELENIDTVLMGMRPDHAEALVATTELQARHCVCLPAWTGFSQ